MYETLERCPVCSGTEFTNYLICKDHSISQENFAIVKCNNCSLLFTTPRPSPKNLSRYYESQDYISHQDKATNPINWVYKLARFFTLRSKVKLIERYQSASQLLDVGCGTGHFLKQAQKNNWQVTGVEPGNDARKIAGNLLRDRVFSSLDDLDGKTFNIITLWHVLEHVTDLNTYLRTLKKMLAKSGTIIVAVPNHKSYDAMHYKQHWAAYDVPRHLYHFDQSTLSQLFKNHNLKIIDTLPMKLDAFYVSLLSEKYLKRGIKGYLNSIITGLKSNSYAKQNHSEYSSLIYVIESK